MPLFFTCILFYTLSEGKKNILKGADKMENKITLKDAIEIYKGVDKSFYWLDYMVTSGLISKALAGYILTYC